MGESQEFPQLKALLATLAPIPDEQWPLLLKWATHEEFPLGARLVEQGSVASRIFLVEKGLVKTSYVQSDGKETTKGFVREGRLAAPYVSILTGQNSNFSIVALEATTVTAVAARAIPSLYSMHPCWQEVSRKIAEGLLVERELREYQMLMQNAETRYAEFLRNFPELVDRVPLYEIASYLGITAVALSQIRRRRAAR